MSPWDTEAFYRRSFDAERRLLEEIRRLLIRRRTHPEAPDAISADGPYAFDFDPEISQVYVTLFQPGLKPLRWGSRKESFTKTLDAVVASLAQREGVDAFELSDPKRCRILFEIVVQKEPCDPKRTTILRLGRHRLEPGIHGLMFRHGGRAVFFMPTDAYVQSLMSMKQIYAYLARRCGLKGRNDTEKAKALRALESPFYRIRSLAFITDGTEVRALYRGMAQPVDDSAEAVCDATRRSCDWLLQHMEPSGKFLYYYDALTGSRVDFNHPKNPGYYNILRHCGGTITLLRAFERYGDARYLEGAERSIGFLQTTLREHETPEGRGLYPFYNAKSKLGGAGVALVSLMHHYQATRSLEHRDTVEALVRHLLSRIDADGEMIGYYIHPFVNGGHPITDPDEKTKRGLFSFYYPGEALLGLALYYRHMPTAAYGLKARVLEASKRAMDFLVFERPRRYAELFLSLPADAWLMQAVEEWMQVAPMHRDAYTDFVFADADAMLDHMYREHNSPFFDYVGGFFYRYGEHVLPDGSRCEGLYAAYEVARMLDDTEKMQRYDRAMRDAAASLMRTCNTPENAYVYKEPENALGAFRFKLTRQWMRVDSVQHTACFFARLLTTKLLKPR